MMRNAALVIATSTLLLAVRAVAQRKPDPPPYTPPPLPRNVVDQALLDALETLGYSRVAVLVQIHASDTLPEIAAEATTQRTSTDGRSRVRRRCRLWGVIPKEDETNAWRMVRTLGARLQDTLRHRQMRMSLVSLKDLGPALAREVRQLTLRDEQGAARRIAEAVDADLVVVVMLTRAAGSDAGGARYGAYYFLADAARNEIIDSWAWDLRADRAGRYTAPVLGYYARHLAVRIHDRLVAYARQARAADGTTRRRYVLRFHGVRGAQAVKVRSAIEKVADVQVTRLRFDADDGEGLLVAEAEASLAPDLLASQLVERLRTALSMDVACRSFDHRTLDFIVSEP